MFSPGQSVCTSRQKEQKLSKIENLLVKLLKDNIFVDYFNIFLNLPVFGQRVLIKQHERAFILDPPLFEAVQDDKVIAWLAARRFDLFAKTDLYLEYRLCHDLCDIDFELRFKHTDCDRWTGRVLQVFANNLLGSVAGMYLFREHLRDTAGSNVYGCWLHVQRFRQTRNPAKRREIFREIQQRYLHATAVHKLSNRLCKVVIRDLLKFPVLPAAEPALSGQLESNSYLPLSEVDLSSRDALVHVHHVLLDALRAYWVPRYIMHVLATQPLSVLKELFSIPAGTVMLGGREVDALIRACPLVAVQRCPASNTRHDDDQTESDNSSLATVSPSSSMPSLTSLSLSSISTAAKTSPFKSISSLESCPDLHLPSQAASYMWLATEGRAAFPPFLTLGQCSPSSRLPLFYDAGKTEEEASEDRDYAGDEELTGMYGVDVLKDSECDSLYPVENDNNRKICSNRNFVGDKRSSRQPATLSPNGQLCLKSDSANSPRRHSSVWETMRANAHRSKGGDPQETSSGLSAKKTSLDKQDGNEKNAWNPASVPNVTRLALKETALQPELVSQLLQHYLLGYRHLDRERPVTDRRTLCLLACDELAGSPFRSYLRRSDQHLHLSYFDFWSVMRRYQQLQDLHRMSEVMNTDNGPRIAVLRKRQIRYMVDRFLMGSGQDTRILQYNIRLRILEDIRESRWSPLINSTVDVMSQSLRVPMKQFILHDRRMFHKFLSGEGISSPEFVDRRSLSDPWRDDPHQDPEGDMESMSPADPDGIQHQGVVGVLGEQHRLLAFQFLIILREDLRASHLCDLASLAEIAHSEYGSLHISCTPVTDSKDRGSVAGREKDEGSYEFRKRNQWERFLKAENKSSLNRFGLRELKHPQREEKTGKLPPEKDSNARERCDGMETEKKWHRLEDEGEENMNERVTVNKEMSKARGTSSSKEKRAWSKKKKRENLTPSFEQNKEERSRKHTWFQSKQTKGGEYEENKYRAQHAQDDLGCDEIGDDSDDTVQSDGDTSTGVQDSKEVSEESSSEGLASLNENADSTSSTETVLPRETASRSKAIALWRNLLRCIRRFTISLSRPDERKLFEVFLNLELSKSKISGDKALKYIDREGFKHKMYIRRALKNLSISVNKLPADLRFWVEAHRFEGQICSHLRSTENVGDAIEKDNPMLGMRANAIMDCFFKSVCDPVIQVNCCNEKDTSRMTSELESRGVTTDLFHDIYIQLFPLLFKLWKQFSQEWLSKLHGPNRKEIMAQLLASYKNPIIGDTPHPDKPSADYLDLTSSDFNFCPLSEKDRKGGVESVLKFTIQHGVRVVYSEKKEKSGQLAECRNNNKNN